MAQKKKEFVDSVQIESKKRKRSTTTMSSNSSFNRRKTVIEKKAYELSTLCDTPVCVVIYGPNQDNIPSCVWPTDPRTVSDTLARYLNTTKPSKDRPIKSEGDRVLKGTVGETQVENLPRFESAADGVVIDSLSSEQLVELGNRLESKIDAVNAKIDAIRRGQSTTTTAEFDQKNVEYYCGEEQQMTTMMPTIEDIIIQVNDDFCDQFGDESGMITPTETSPITEFESVQCCALNNMTTASTDDLNQLMENFEYDRFAEELQRDDLGMINGMETSQNSTMTGFDQNVHYCGEQQMNTMTATTPTTDDINQVTQNLECQYDQYQFPNVDNSFWERFEEELTRDDDMIDAMNGSELGINDENVNVNVGEYSCCGLMGEINSIDGFELGTFANEWCNPSSQIPVQAHQFEAGHELFRHEITNF